MKKIFIITLATVTMFYVTASIFQFGYKKSLNHIDYAMDKIFNDTTYYNTVLLGNSKVKFGLNPCILDSVAKVNSINLGYASSNFPMQELILKAYLQKHRPPQFVLLGLDEANMFDTIDNSNKIPLYDYIDNQVVLDFFKNQHLPYRIQQYLPYSKFLYLDDYSRFNSISGLLGKSNFLKKEIIQCKGFYIDTSMNAIKFIKKTNHESSHSLSKTMDMHFQSIVTLCKKHNITLVFTVPPILLSSKRINNRIQFLNSIKKLSLNNKAILLGNGIDSLFTISDFVDGSHVNYRGSIKYSLLTAQQLSKINMKGN